MRDSESVATLSARGAGRTFGKGRRSVHAVRPLDLDLMPGRAVGIAGESGSGKSTLLRMLLGLEPSTDGTVTFEGVSIPDLDRAGRARYRAAVQAVFQDPGSSLDPRMVIWRSITEPVWISEGLDCHERHDRALALLDLVELPRAFVDRLPHQLSGGERQRVAIARALSSSPRLVLLDEPVTSLDVSVRGAIINLLADRAADVTYVVVSHDLTVIAHLAHELIVMYAGFVVEQGTISAVLDAPIHPYTQALVASVQDPLHAGDSDTDAVPPPGACPYITRCPHAFDACQVMPEPRGVDHMVRCHLA